MFGGPEMHCQRCGRPILWLVPALYAGEGAKPNPTGLCVACRARIVIKPERIVAQ